jgi:Glyoxalase/Bleomycin resistance protein/Dioxygenase superfamily
MEQVMIEGIDSITYSTDGTVENWAMSKKFFLDWGLSLVTESNNELVFETLNGSRVLVLAPNHASLFGTTPMESGATLREVVWGVTSQTTLDKLSSQHGLQTTDPHGLRIKFQLSAKRSIPLQGSPSNAWGDVRRVDAPSPVYERAVPIEIGHVVLFTDCLAEAVAFYEQLGFTVSDQYPNRGVFLRCSKTGGHRCVFAASTKQAKGTQSRGVYRVRYPRSIWRWPRHEPCGLENATRPRSSPDIKRLLLVLRVPRGWPH